MPVVTITLLEGYDENTRQTLGQRLTDAVRATIAAPLEGITVILHEVANPAGYMRGRVSRPPGAPLPPPAKVVRAYLDAAAARDFAKAGEMVADGFSAVYPGGAEFGGLEELVPWAEERYRFVKKTYERIDEAACEEGVAVYAFGTLSGEWPDGTAFDGIRFIDRFTVRDGKLTDQRVWNDLADARTAPA